MIVKEPSITLVRLGYTQGDIVPVPDPEANARVVLTDPSGKVKLTWRMPAASASLKRQSPQDLSDSTRTCEY